MRIPKFLRRALRVSCGLIILVALLLGGRALYAYFAPDAKMQEVGERLFENSGLAVAPVAAQGFWSIADSGSTPTLYALDKQGKIQARYPLELPLPKDWESIATDHHRRVFIADVGDNFRVRPHLAITEIHLNQEGQPDSKPQGRYLLKYPRGQDTQSEGHDAEAVIFLAGSFYLFTKRRIEPVSEVFRFASGESVQETLQTGVRVARVALAEPGSWINFGKVVTGASIDPSGRALALLSYRQVLVYRDSSLPDWSDSKLRSSKESDARLLHLLAQKPERWTLRLSKSLQCEGISFRQGQLYISNEKGFIYPLSEVARKN